MQDSSLPPAGILRRLGALIYDGLLVIALWFLGTALLLPFTHGEAIPSSGPMNAAYQLYLAVICFLFLAWFWTHGGQTAGMKAWRLRVVTTDGKRFGWRRAALRFGASLLFWLPAYWQPWAGFGLWLLAFGWMLVNDARLTWYDRLSGTALQVLPKGVKARDVA